jgi:hypothetical protein
MRRLADADVVRSTQRQIIPKKSTTVKKDVFAFDDDAIADEPADNNDNKVKPNRKQPQPQQQQKQSTRAATTTKRRVRGAAAAAAATDADEDEDNEQPKPMSLSRKFRELYANPERPMERENRQAKLVALQRNVEEMLAHLSAMSDFARVGGDVDAYEYERHAAADGEYEFDEAHDAYDDEEEFAAIERDFNGERIAAASAATNEDGAMQASYHRSIFQFRKHADGRVLQAPQLTPLHWSDMFVRKVERAGVSPTEGDESVMSAELRSQLYRQHCARINALCDATIAESQGAAIQFVVDFVRDFVPRESVRSALVRLPVAMLVEAGNASDHDAFHAHLGTRLRSEWSDLVHVTLEPHMCSSWQRALIAIGSQILPRDWRGPRDLRDAHEWLRREFRGRESPRIVVTIRKFAALPRDIVTDLLVRLEGAARMPHFCRKLAVLLDVVHASADEALTGVPWRVRMYLVVEMIGMPSPRTTGAAVADQVLVQPAANGAAAFPFLLGADTSALAMRMFVHGTMDPSLFQEVVDVAMLEHVRNNPAAWMACLPRAPLPPAEFDGLAVPSAFDFGGDTMALWAAVSMQHLAYVACLPSVKLAFARRRRAHDFAHDRLLTSTLPTSERATLAEVRSLVPRWLAALDCARFRVSLLRVVFLAFRSARLFFVAEDDAGVWWHALSAGDSRWLTKQHPPSPHQTTPWANTFVELHDEAQIGNRRAVPDADAATFAGFGRAELRAALQRRLDVAKDDAGAASMVPLLLSLLDDCVRRLSAELERHAVANDAFGVHGAMRVEHNERVTQLRAAAAHLRATAEHGGAALASAAAAPPPQSQQQSCREAQAFDRSGHSAVCRAGEGATRHRRGARRRARDTGRLVALSRAADSAPAAVGARGSGSVRARARRRESESRQADQSRARASVAAARSARGRSARGRGGVQRVSHLLRSEQRRHQCRRLVSRLCARAVARRGRRHRRRVRRRRRAGHLSVSPPIAAKLHVFADAVLQLQHHGVVGAIHKSRGIKNAVELVRRLV